MFVSCVAISAAGTMASHRQGEAIDTDWALRGKSLLVSCVAISTAGAVDKHSQTKLLAWMGAVRKKLDCQLCGNLHSWHSGQPQTGEAIDTD